MTKQEKTLVILTPGFPKDEADSTCLPMQQQLVKSLRINNPGLNITVLAFQYPYHSKKYDWFGIEVIPFNGRNKGGLQRLWLRQRIKRVLKTINCNYSIASLLSFWYGECAVVGHQFADKNSLRHFCWVLGQDAKKENKYPRKVFLRPGELIALSDFLKDEFKRNHGVEPQHLVTAGIEPNLFEKTSTQRDIDILGVGSLIPLKQYEIFIEIIAVIKKKLPAIKAVLAGDGPERQKLQNLVIKSGLEKNIEIRGEITYGEVLQLMQSSRLLIHPSSYEGFSGVCLEALFAGAQVISFCKAMNQEIEQWHIVSSKENLLQTALSILQNPSTSHQAVLFSSINEVEKKMKDLFFQHMH